MTTTAKDQLPVGDRETIISTMIVLILDQLNQTVDAPDPHYNYLRALFQRYPLHVVISEMRNILTSLYFPPAADLARLVMEYSGVTLVPQQRPGGYCTTFTYKGVVYFTSVAATPFKSVELAQYMLEQLHAGVQLSPSQVEEPVRQDAEQAEEATVTPPDPASPGVDIQSSPAFIRVGRMALAIDKILYVKDDSSAHYQSIRVGLAGGVDMRFDANPANNYIHTQEVRFIGEEARAFLAWHRRETLPLAAPDVQEKSSNHEHTRT